MNNSSFQDLLWPQHKAGTVLVLKTTIWMILFHFRRMNLLWKKKKNSKNHHCLEKTTIAELLTECTEPMAPGSSAKQSTHFALLVDKKLGRLSQRNRVIAEKRIMDILFEIEINEFE